MRVVDERARERESLLCPVADNPLVPRPRGLLLVVDTSGAQRSRVKHAGARNMDGTGLAGIRYDTSGLGGAGEVLAQRVLSVSLGEILLPPHARADPDTCDAQDHDDEEDDPLVMAGQPRQRPVSTPASKATPPTTKGRGKHTKCLRYCSDP